METIINRIKEIKSKYDYLLNDGADIKGILEKLEPSISEMWHILINKNNNDKLFIIKNYLKQGQLSLYRDCLKDYRDFAANNDEVILDDLVYSARKYLCENTIGTVEDNTYFNTFRCCRLASNYVNYMAESLNVKSSVKFVGNVLPLEYFDHAFVLVELNNKKYIIDCAYSQFISLYYSSLDVMLSEIFQVDAGYFLIYNEAKYKFLLSFLKRGWFEATDENLKMYFDSFVLSNRNVRYYLNNENFNMMDTKIDGSYYSEMLSKNTCEESSKFNKIYGSNDEFGVAGIFYSKEEKDIIKRKIITTKEILVK